MGLDPPWQGRPRSSLKSRSSRADNGHVSNIMVADSRNTPAPAHDVFVVEDPSSARSKPKRSRRSSNLFRKEISAPATQDKEPSAGEKRGSKRVKRDGDRRCMKCGMTDTCF